MICYVMLMLTKITFKYESVAQVSSIVCLNCIVAQISQINP